jgi:ABC-type transporter Mla subunit MlaD
MLIRAGIALGPALIPTLAAATPAAFGLAAGLAAAATGGAVAALALNGVGDALSALNDYQLDPTADNLEKVEQAMAQLSPAAQEFSLFLQDLRPELQGLQDIAAEGALPGFQEGIDDIMTGLPVFERLVDNTASALGRLAADAGQAFRDDPFWMEFTRFIADEAGPTLETYGRIFANFGKMAGGVIMAFDPLADDFNASLLGISQRLAEWGTNLGDSSGFREFTDYIRDAGPQVWDTLGSIANALIQLVQAAAPLGGPTLQIISAIADTIGAIADSPIGPVLIGVASGLSAIASIKNLGQIASLQSVMGLIRGGAADGAAAGIGFGRAAAGCWRSACRRSSWWCRKPGASIRPACSATGARCGSRSALAAASIWRPRRRPIPSAA